MDIILEAPVLRYWKSGTVASSIAVMVCINYEGSNR